MFLCKQVRCYLTKIYKKGSRLHWRPANASAVTLRQHVYVYNRTIYRIVKTFPCMLLVNKVQSINYIACLVEFGGHNLNALHPIRPVKFDRSNWVELGVNPLRLHCLLKDLDYIVCLVKFGGHNLNDLHPI